jgi:AcrR family transcriptional regulator
MSAQVPPTPDSLLRTAPRQERSERRINLILDTAAGLFDEIGYDATTTKHVADRANIAVGSIYHWFPDKTALATALAERYLAELLALYDIELTDDPTESTANLITRVSAVLAVFVKSNPAFITLLVEAFAPGGESSPCTSADRSSGARHTRSRCHRRHRHHRCGYPRIAGVRRTIYGRRATTSTRRTLLRTHGLRGGEIPRRARPGVGEPATAVDIDRGRSSGAGADRFRDCHLISRPGRAAYVRRHAGFLSKTIGNLAE